MSTCTFLHFFLESCAFGTNGKIGIGIAVNAKRCACHYENWPIQYIVNFNGCKNDNFLLNFSNYFHIFAQNRNFGYTFDYPLSMY